MISAEGGSSAFALGLGSASKIKSGKQGRYFMSFRGQGTVAKLVMGQ